MVDTVTPRRRSEIMARIGPRHTGPELAVRSAAHAMGLRFRLHGRGLPGRPDLVFQRHNLAIFVHGCFWHRHAGCKNCTWPKTRSEFWQRTFKQNVTRDLRSAKSLALLGWKVEVIWECETENPELLKARLKSLFPAKKRRISRKRKTQSKN